MRVPGGGDASCLGVGRPGLGALPPPTTRPFGRAAGAHYPLAVAAGGAGVGTRHQPHSARSCELALRAVAAARGRPGGAPLVWVWDVRGRVLSHPRPLVLSGVRPGPTTHWRWVRGCGRGDPSPTLQRALLRAGFARCGGGMRVPGGLPFAWVWGVRGRALSHPRPLVLSGVRSGPGTHWLWVQGVRAWGPVTNPTARALASCLARCGGGMRVPGGVASCLGVGPPGSGALPTPTTRPFGRAAGAHYPLAVSAGGAGVGTRHQPHSARSCELALRAVGAARGRPGGAPLAPVWDVRGRALSHPGPLVLSGVRPGPTTHWLWVRGVWAWEPVTNPTARALASLLCALWGRHEGARGGRLLPGRGASGVGRSPDPDHSSFRACGRGPLPTGCGCGGCGRGDPSPTHQHALLRAGFARCGGGTRAPGGAPLAWVWAVRSRVLSHPRPLVLSGVRPGPTTHWLWVRGVWVLRPVTNFTARAPTCCLVRCGGGMRVPGGGAPLAWVWGNRDRALPHPPPLVLSGVRPGPTTH